MAGVRAWADSNNLLKEMTTFPRGNIDSFSDEDKFEINSDNIDNSELHDESMLHSRSPRRHLNSFIVDGDKQFRIMKVVRKDTGDKRGKGKNVSDGLRNIKLKVDAKKIKNALTKRRKNRQIYRGDFIKHRTRAQVETKKTYENISKQTG